ncbi:hypothetical protein HDU98_000296 [Podochytrium sp. JEL0797]|nr:hypothetical protein HDU98_000296 [Podochytrium sp. JEL0797]
MWSKCRNDCLPDSHRQLLCRTRRFRDVEAHMSAQHCATANKAVADDAACGILDSCKSSNRKCCMGPKDVISGTHTCKRKQDCFDSSPMWAGANSYFMANLPESEQRSLLSSLQQSGVTVVRIFVTQFGQGGKGTNAEAVRDLEMTTVGVYDDTILQRIDLLLSLVPDYNIKLIIALHDRWNLDNTWGTCDAYCQAYCGNPSVVAPGKCTLPGGAATFYTSPVAQKQFDNRIAHILNHQGPGGRPWSSNWKSIYAFEIQNEGQSALGGTMPNPDWWCGRAKAINKLLSPNEKIRISTGGTQYAQDSLIASNFKCREIDIIAVHSYADIGPFVPLMRAIQKNYGKEVVMQEFGSTGASQALAIQYTAGLMNFNRIPWMVWEVSSVTVPNDYEFSPSQTTSWNTLAQYAHAAN